MPLFGHKKKKPERSDSWSLGKGGSKSGKDSENEVMPEGMARKEAPPAIAEMDANAIQLPSDEQTTGTVPASTEPRKGDAAELENSTISSLPPSHRGGASVSGSEPTRVSSTTATSLHSSPSEQHRPNFVVPDSAEKEAVVSKGPSMDSTNLTRAESEKQPESSAFLPSVSSPGSLSRGYREYNFYNTPSFKDLVICNPNQKAIFYAEASSYRRSKSDVALREFGEDFDIPASKSMSLNDKEVSQTSIVASADFIPDENAKQIKLGIGDPLDPAACSWVMMKNITPSDATDGVEKFEMAVARAEGDLIFQWIKGAPSEASKESSGAKEAYRLVCEDTVVASFRNTSMKNMRKRGSLRIYDVPMVEQYLVLIFLSASAMSEMYRRRRSKKVRKTFLVPF